MRASMIKCAAGIVTADNVIVDTSGFTKILGPFDNDIQKALATLDVLPEYAQEAGFPRGIEDRDDSELIWDDATLTLTHAIKAPATGFSIIEAASGTAVRYTFVTDRTATIAIPAAGSWWFYYDGGVLQSAQTLPYGFKTTICALVFLNASNSAIAVLDERHTVFMPWKTHQYLHTTISTRYQSGLAISRIASGSGNVNGDAEIYITGGQIWDEDIAVDISRNALPIQMFAQELGEVGVPGQIPIYYRSGVGSSNWEKIPASNAPLYQILAVQRPTFNNEVGGSWIRTEISGNSRYCIMWICATNNIGNADRLGFMVEPVFAIMGQGDYTIGQAQETTFSQLDLGDLFTEELKPLYKIIYRCSRGYGNTYHARIHEIDDLRNVSPAPSGSVVATDHQSLGGRTVEGSHPSSAVSIIDTEYGNNIPAVTNSRLAFLALDTLGIMQGMVRVDKLGNDSTGRRGYPGKPYLTVAAALAVAQEGDTIFFGPGEWTEVITIPDVVKLHFKGSGRGITRLASLTSVFVSSSAISLEELTISDMTIEGVGNWGIYIIGAGAGGYGLNPLRTFTFRNLDIISYIDQTIWLQCVGYVRTEDVTVYGGAYFSEIGDIKFRNLRTAAEVPGLLGPGNITLRFDVLEVLPGAFVSGTFKFYSLKVDSGGTVNQTGATTITYDASCEVILPE